MSNLTVEEAQAELRTGEVESILVQANDMDIKSIKIQYKDGRILIVTPKERIFFHSSALILEVKKEQ